jgi:hypothetical protein
MSNNSKCAARNPSTCPKHGWVKRPIDSETAFNNMNDAAARMQTAYGAEAFKKADQEYRKAHNVYNSTPAGQKELKGLIKKAREEGRSAISYDILLKNAQYRRIFTELKYKMEAFEGLVEVKNKPSFDSKEGKALMNELTEINKGEPVEGNNWDEAVYNVFKVKREELDKKHYPYFSKDINDDVKSYGFTIEAKNSFGDYRILNK